MFIFPIFALFVFGINYLPYSLRALLGKAFKAAARVTLGYPAIIINAIA